MKDINLIPPDVIQGRQIAGRVRLWITVDAAVLATVVVVLGIAFWSARGEGQAVGKLDSRVTELQGLTIELQDLRGERSRLGEEERALASLLDRTPDCRVLRRIAEAVEDNGWLTGLELIRPVGEEKETGVLKIDGHAGSYDHLARLMMRLDALGYTAGVDLKASQRVVAADLDVIRFQLECPLGAGPPAGSR